MKNLTLSILCAGLMTTSAIAEDICNGAFSAQNYEQSAQCYVKQLKKQPTYYNLLLTGISYGKMGRDKEALVYLKKAEKKAVTPSDYATLSGWLSKTYGDLGDRVKELVYSMKYLNLSLQSQNNYDIGEAYSNLGVYYSNQEDYKKALEYYKKALEYLTEQESGFIYNNMAVAYGNLGDNENAEAMSKKAINSAQQSGNISSLINLQVNLGKFYYMQDRNTEARTILQEACTNAHNNGIIDNESNALSIISVIDYHVGDKDKAKEEAKQALFLAKQSGSTNAMSEANGALEIVNGN